MKTSFPKALLARHETYLALIIILFSIVLANATTGFLTAGNLLSVMRGGAGLGILSLAFFVALVSGGIDISFPAIAISGQYIAIRAMLAFGINSIWAAFGISIAIGIAYGLFNAFLITKFKIPSMIATLATFNLYHGALLEFVGTEAVNVGRIPTSITEFGRMAIFRFETEQGPLGLSIFVVVWGAAIAATWFIMRRTMLGRGIYAIGGDAEGAKRAGFRVTRIRYFVYGYVGFLSGIMGIIHVSLIRFAQPNNIVDTALLRVIAAVILGGTAITGGRGTITGTTLGVIIIILLDRHLIMLGIPSAWTEFFIGIVIVVGVIATHLRMKISRVRRGELVVDRAH
ncbi:MAG: ABC transporter permease [Spirochaetaceae bacterium]|nr:MAG: ABC transporter permease [Spirochaetaceae bacterium]